jgi:hypothetical protein
MLFNFLLKPLNEIMPWGGPGAERLHWFGLTDGSYWLSVGASTLFEYSESARPVSASRTCDYQVVRLYEDVAEMCAQVLDPVPVDLVRFIAGDGRRAALEQVSQWMTDNDDRDDDDYWAVADLSMTWIGQRELDSSHLSPSASIAMWSDEARVHIEWANQAKLIDGCCAWSAEAGSWSLGRQEFTQEFRSFHERLMAAMAERVERVVEGALAPEIEVDIAGLVREHEVRSNLSSTVLGPPPVATNWDSVRRALQACGVCAANA